MMKTILIAIPYGESARNVLQTETFTLLREAPGIDLVILTQAYSDPVFKQENQGPNIHIESLFNYSPSLIERIIAAFRLAAYRRKSSTLSILTDSRQQAFAHAVRFVGDKLMKVLGEKNVLSGLKMIESQLLPAKCYRDVFAKYRPDLVVVTRVLSWSADYPVMKRAAKERVPTVVLVSSWDNLTSKGFYPICPHSLVVWNETMRQEAVDLAGIPADRIVISGVPRFDIYFRREHMRSREDFFESLGLDLDKKLITYTTGADHLFLPYERTSPEPEIVEFLANAASCGNLGFPSQLLVRLHPQARFETYAHLARREGVVLQIPGRSSDFKDRYFSKEDNVILGETMWHSDVVVNVASTITIDAAIFDTPVVCVGFDIRGDRPYLKSVRRFYDFDHYRKLAQTGGFRIAYSKDALLQELRSYLADPARDRDGRRRIVEEQCYYQDGRSGERVAKYILKLLGTLPEHRLSG